jgi:hypothetical protein
MIRHRHTKTLALVLATSALALSQQGCVATTVAGATVGLAATAVGTTAKVAGGAVGLGVNAVGAAGRVVTGGGGGKR